MNAERLLAHYERIADAPDAIHSLRRFILDLAVRGKLVKRDPSDEPVAELLKRITAKKARLVAKAGKVKKGRRQFLLMDASKRVHRSQRTWPSCWQACRNLVNIVMGQSAIRG